jgi:hypothetical protein
MVDVVEQMVFEVRRYTSDTTGQHIELMNSGRPETKKPHLRFDLFCFGSRIEPFVRTLFPGTGRGAGQAMRQTAGKKREAGVVSTA